jgi:crotonobetainyl-CoA:carnitine CoA-transferase CaiB-like acyl-CoA transferase
MNEDHFWVGLCRALDLHEHEQLSNAERNRRVHEMNGLIADTIGRLTQEDALERLRRHDVPASPVLTRPEMLDEAHFRERGTVVVDGDGRPRSGPLVRFEQSPGRPPFGAAEVGTGAATWPPR